jgi:hypothetical protein
MVQLFHTKLTNRIQFSQTEILTAQVEKEKIMLLQSLIKDYSDPSSIFQKNLSSMFQGVPNDS